MTARTPGVTYLLVARLPVGGVGAFDAYEAAVLPLLERHGGRLERRLRSVDGRLEAHVVSFPDEAASAAYRNDPRRRAAAPLLEASGAQVELFAVGDVPASPGHTDPRTTDEGAMPG